MTTKAAAASYLASHLRYWEGHSLAVYNPLGKPLGDLPVIYGFNNGGTRGCLSAVLLAEDGTGMGGHCCSDEGYMPSDLGCIEGSRPDRHEEFRAHYPNGYRMEFVQGKDVKTHTGLLKAYALNQSIALESK